MGVWVKRRPLKRDLRETRMLLALGEKGKNSRICKGRGSLWLGGRSGRRSEEPGRGLYRTRNESIEPREIL